MPLLWFIAFVGASGYALYKYGPKGKLPDPKKYPANYPNGADYRQLYEMTDGKLKFKTEDNATFTVIDLSSEPREHTFYKKSGNYTKNPTLISGPRKGHVF